MSQRNRFKELTAKAKKITPVDVPAPVDPTIDPEAQALADRLMAQFSGKTTGEPTAPAPSVESKTTSLDPQRFEDLKNLKEIQARAEAAEKKAAHLEQSLEAVTTCLVDFTIRQQRVFNGELTY